MDSALCWRMYDFDNGDSNNIIVGTGGGGNNFAQDDYYNGN